jgi:hypothetical protein
MLIYQEPVFGVFCAALGNPCAVNACQNGGTCCPTIPWGYFCQCVSGWVGKNCEIGMYTIQA